MASRMVRGTPSATVVDEPKLEVMSARTIPLSESTSGPLEPSPGNGPAVSSGMTSQAPPAAAADVLPAAPVVVEAETRSSAQPAMASKPVIPASRRRVRRSISVERSKARPRSKISVSWS